ncbi:MAG: RsmD family RNA methyltransferase [Candidatus Adiutrix sp.]
MPHINSGCYKGAKLVAPKGVYTRPTADKIKEAIFSTLISLGLDFNQLAVLDLFAGSGALAFEALSRGAAKAVLCDRDLGALKALKHNLSILPEAKGEILKAHWPRGLNMLKPHGPFGLFFLDPPYEQTSLPQEMLKCLGHLSATEGAMAVWEQDPSTLKLWGEHDVQPWRLMKIKQWKNQSAAFFTLGQ